MNWSPLSIPVTPTSGTTITTTAVAPIQPPSVVVNPQSASIGQIVTVTGQGFTPNSTISTLGINIGGMIGNASSVPLDMNGNFSYSFILSAMPSGTYAVKVTDVVGRSASATFIVTTPNTTPPPTISLTPTSGSPGSKFTINGYNFTPYGTIQSADVLFNNVASTGTKFSIDNIGDVSFTLTLSATQQVGTYTIMVTDSSGKSASANFTVLPQTTTTTIMTTTTQSFLSSNIILTPTSGSPGSIITINGYNFTPNGTVTSSNILWSGLPTTGGQTFNIDGTGHVSFTLTLSTTQSVGTYIIKVTDSGGKSANANFTVLPQTTTTTTMTMGILYPANGATSVPILGITFTWSAVSGSNVTYQFALAQASANTSANKFALLDYSDNTTTNAEPAQETLQYNTVYWWEVRAF